MLATKIFARGFHSSSAAYARKVAVLGAGGIGQPLSLLLKNEGKLVSKLALFDIVNTPGVAADLSHIATPVDVKGYKGTEELDAALQGAEVVVIPAGVPRKPGMTRDDLFKTNAGIVKNLAEACAKNCPKAHFLIISNPVNSTVPIFAEVLKKHGVYNPKHLFGVTTLDVVRASTFVGQVKKANPESIKVHVVGGHSGPTIVPLLSQTGLTFTDEERAALTYRIQYGGDEVVKAKDGTGSATLSMAVAGARFAVSLLKALEGEKGIVEPTFVESPVLKAQGVDFFATKVELGKDGVEKIHPIGALSKYEEELLEKCVPELKANIKKGLDFVKSA
ncbi:malate dehydrogenase [Catenaria anguillulae PL171]|uniref:Malate dehydrogenase n=1 Tax=Catenaria anguillulae PL171 TaxID=765915 RepID=A0A1Y2HR43_9FUNG|nr:malate dehydrogenase [Catenaria anguillulae PL171]